MKKSKSKIVKKGKKPAAAPAEKLMKKTSSGKSSPIPKDDAQAIIGKIPKSFRAEIAGICASDTPGNCLVLVQFSNSGDTSGRYILYDIDPSSPASAKVRFTKADFASGVCYDDHLGIFILEDRTVHRFDGHAWSSALVADALMSGVFTIAGKVFLFGAGGSVHTFDGKKWSKQKLTREHPIRTMHGRDLTDLRVSGIGGVVQCFDGKSWKLMTSPAQIKGQNGHPLIVNSVYVAKDGSFYYGGKEPQFYRIVKGKVESYSLPEDEGEVECFGECPCNKKRRICKYNGGMRGKFNRRRWGRSIQDWQIKKRWLQN